MSAAVSADQVARGAIEVGTRRQADAAVAYAGNWPAWPLRTLRPVGEPKLPGSGTELVTWPPPLVRNLTFRGCMGRVSGHASSRMLSARAPRAAFHRVAGPASAAGPSGIRGAASERAPW
jgi:hypothetical protein